VNYIWFWKSSASGWGIVSLGIKSIGIGIGIIGIGIGIGFIRSAERGSADLCPTGYISAWAQSGGPCHTGIFVVRGPVSYGEQLLTYLFTRSVHWITHTPPDIYPIILEVVQLFREKFGVWFPISFPQWRVPDPILRCETQIIFQICSCWGIGAFYLSGPWPNQRSIDLQENYGWLDECVNCEGCTYRVGRA